MYPNGNARSLLANYKHTEGLELFSLLYMTQPWPDDASLGFDYVQGEARLGLGHLASKLLPSLLT